MLGISVYLGHDTIANQEAYIRKMNENGFKSIFTSLHIPEDDPSRYNEQLQHLGKLAQELKMELMADISPASLKLLGMNWKTVKQLRDWGVTGLRVDYGVDEQTIVDLSKKIKIALNASTITEQSLLELKRMGLAPDSVEAWHNFYPRPETGLGWTDFVKRNKWLKSEGLSVMAFIPGDGHLRGPLFCKLPTLEKQRNQVPFTSFIEMKQEGYVDKILIGDITISAQSLEQFTAFRKGNFLIRAQAHPKINPLLLKRLEGTHTNRLDHARDVIRSVESRQYASVSNSDIKPFNCSQRPIGTITIDNEKYLRYQGEVQITRTDLPADEKVNVLGRVIPEDRLLLKHIKGNHTFNIKWVK